MECTKQYLCHGGTLGYYTHQSAQTKTPMSFSVFLPENHSTNTPYIIFLSGLTCTEDNFTTKANAYQKANELGLAIIAPDTSPRGDNVPNHDDYDLGQGAGFYINATQAPWSENFQMESYIIDELISLVEKEFPLNSNQKSITGHSMGGHGALTLYLKYPGLFQSCSAFAPIVAPSQVPWGHKAFTAYLGDNQDEWKNHDACHLISQAQNTSQNNPILIDQGMDDMFLDEQLKPHLFEQACQDAGQNLTCRQHKGYDHSYFFIQSFIDDHLEWHNKYFTQ